MFTGIVEEMGSVKAVEPSRLVIEAPRVTYDLEVSDSICVNGACLTVTSREGASFAVDVVPQTLSRTDLGALRVADLVNLERPLAVGERFGGHIVQGHVDGTAEVKAIREEGDTHGLTFSVSSALAACFIPKGSVAVDGVSLTVASLRDGEFDAMIVPFTWDHTNLHALRPLDRVNLECDLVGKYIVRATQIALTER